MTTATHYIGSDGKRHEITAMAYRHLASALAKLERNPLAMDTRSPEIEAMRAEKAKRDEEYAAAEAAKAAQGEGQ